MATIVDHINTRLQSSASLLGTLSGGVWTRELKRTGPGATPGAFGPEGQMRPAAVIADQGDNLHPQAAAIPSAYSSFPQIYLYAPATESGKQAIAGAFGQIVTLLEGWTFQTDAGPVAFVSIVGRLGLRDSDELPGAVFDYVRCQVVARWREVA